MVLPVYDRNPTSGRTWVTVLLIVVNVGVFVLLQGGGRASDQQQATYDFEHAAIPCELIRQRPLTVEEINEDVCVDAPVGRPAFPDKHVDLAIIVSMFLHVSWLHLAGNMLFLWIFGNNIEDRLGPVPYLAFYVFGGVVAALAQLALDPTSTTPVLGASGAIAAVMGAYLIWYPRARVLAFIGFIIPLPLPAFVVLGFWFVSQFFTQGAGDVAWMAHVGGFVFGMVIAWLLRRTRTIRPSPGYL
ncbi:MAG: hypothetical protein QOE63_1903 [Acidimicrobiaceae bacterium]